MQITPKFHIYPDWPSLSAIAAPAILGGPVGWACGEWVWGASPIIAVAGLAMAAAASYGVSCRVADRSGQPWAYLSFFASLSSWLFGLYALFSAAPLYK
jgi:hypothetical protein